MKLKLNTKNLDGKSPAFIIGAVVVVITLAALGLALQAWLLMMVLSWFAIKLTLWQCAAIVFLVQMLLSSAKSSSS
jgi:hypothetical protein